MHHPCAEEGKEDEDEGVDDAEDEEEEEGEGEAKKTRKEKRKEWDLLNDSKVRECVCLCVCGCAHVFVCVCVCEGVLGGGRPHGLELKATRSTCRLRRLCPTLLTLLPFHAQTAPRPAASRPPIPRPPPTSPISPTHLPPLHNPHLPPTPPSPQAIWLRSPKDVSEEEYSKFYKAVSKDYGEALGHVHFKAEGDVEFKWVWEGGRCVNMYYYVLSVMYNVLFRD